MSAWCFLSYSHEDASQEPYLADFAKDLREELRLLLPADTDRVFFDTNSIKTGQFWDARIQEAIGRARTMVCLTSPSYDGSDYCSKEFEGFRARVDAYTARNGLAAQPELLLPISWSRPDLTYPERLTRIQYADDEFPEAYRKLGLRQLMRLNRRYGEEYKEFVTTLATKLVQAGTAHVLPASAVPADPNVPPAAPATADGPGQVCFVFVAGKPQELAGIGKKNVACYGNSGGSEWQPFLPDVNRAVGPLAGEIAFNQDFFRVHEMQLGNDLIQRIASAAGKRNVIVLFVDPWSLNVQDYCAWMKAYDSHNFRSCAVMVPWNENDPDNTPAALEVLKKRIGETFQFRMEFKRKVYFTYPVRSLQDFRTKLKITLSQLRGAVISAAPAQKPVDGQAMVDSANQRGSSIGSISIISGPGNGQ
jgi:FxsC-like protein